MAEFGGFTERLPAPGAPLVAAAVWGGLSRRRRRIRPRTPQRLLLELLVFGAGVAALARLTRRRRRLCSVRS